MAVPADVSMANSLYDIAASAMMGGTFNWLTADLMVVAWASPADFNPADRMLNDIKARGGFELGSSLPIVNKTIGINGTGQTDAVLIPNIPIGQVVTWFTMCIREAVHDTSTLVLFLDEVDGLPFDPNGLDLTIQPDWLQNRGWFRP